MIETQVVDNFLPQQMADYLESMLLGSDFPWYYVPDITAKNISNVKETNPGFSHGLYMEEMGPSNFYLSVCNLPFLGCIKLPPSKISRAYAFLQLPQIKSKSYLHNNIHIDGNTPHIVLLYYACSSDGDTFIFSKNKEDITITQRITPKKNRALIFDGSIYHASSKPEEHTRCVINFNLTPYKETK